VVAWAWDVLWQRVAVVASGETGARMKKLVGGSAGRFQPAVPASASTKIRDELGGNWLTNPSIGGEIQGI
jgi:hypothetical protein